MSFDSNNSIFLFVFIKLERETKMKILSINDSQRKEDNSYQLLKTTFKEVEDKYEVLSVDAIRL